MFSISQVWAAIVHAHTHASTTGQTANDHHVSFVQADHDALANPHHARQHSTTAAADHTFPGGTTTYLRADGTFATPATGASGDVAVTSQTLTSNLTVADGTNAITAGHLNLGSYNITLVGTASLFVLA